MKLNIVQQAIEIELLEALRLGKSPFTRPTSFEESSITYIQAAFSMLPGYQRNSEFRIVKTTATIA
jgi:hypothetical protein